VSRRRRAALLLGLALVLGGLAASDVARREAALDARLGPVVPVMVARAAVPEGASLGPTRLAVRRVPSRFAPPGAFRSPAQLSGLRARAPLPPGAYLTPAAVSDPSASGSDPVGALRPGERMAEVTAAADPRYVVPGARVDVLVTRDSADGSAGATKLALRGAEVLQAAPAPADPSGSGDSSMDGPRLRVGLRVTLHQAIYLATAQSDARAIRLLTSGRS
jgi:pilus assembly protein CpaB